MVCYQVRQSWGYAKHVIPTTMLVSLHTLSNTQVLTAWIIKVPLVPLLLQHSSPLQLRHVRESRNSAPLINIPNKCKHCVHCVYVYFGLTCFVNDQCLQHWQLKSPLRSHPTIKLRWGPLLKLAKHTKHAVVIYQHI